MFSFVSILRAKWKCYSSVVSGIFITHHKFCIALAASPCNCIDRPIISERLKSVWNSSLQAEGTSRWKINGFQFKFKSYQAWFCFIYHQEYSAQKLQFVYPLWFVPSHSNKFSPPVIPCDWPAQAGKGLIAWFCFIFFPRFFAWNFKAKENFCVYVKRRNFW